MKTVLITGASRGIGAATARAFFADGYNVAVNYNKSEEKAQTLAKELGALCIKADVSSLSEVKEMIRRVNAVYGHIDVLINNAGIALPTALLQNTDESDFDRVVAVNLKGMYNCSKEVIEQMVDAKSGCIVNVSSMWGIAGGSCETLYSMTKAGVIGFTKALSKELAPSGIRVNAVAPGIIDTDMNAFLSKEDKNEFVSSVPLQRIGTPEDVAAAILFLSSNASSYITGQVLSVDGGFC